MKIIKCEELVERIDTLGFAYYEKCGKTAKYMVSFIDFRGIKTSRNVCGIHNRSIEKWSIRNMSKLNRNVEFNSIPINPLIDPIKQS